MIHVSQRNGLSSAADTLCSTLFGWNTFTPFPDVLACVEAVWQSPGPPGAPSGAPAGQPRGKARPGGFGASAARQEGALLKPVTSERWQRSQKKEEGDLKIPIVYWSMRNGPFTVRPFKPLFEDPQGTHCPAQTWRKNDKASRSSKGSDPTLPPWQAEGP